jgi:precorrin-6B methylase 2
MMLYVRDSDAYEFDPRFEFGADGVVVELGAGTGAAGLALAAAHPHARVVLTDLPEVCPLLQANARGIRWCRRATTLMGLRYARTGTAS